MIRELIVTAVVTAIATGLLVLTYAVGLDDCWPVWLGYGVVCWWFIRQLDQEPA